MADNVKRNAARDAESDSDSDSDFGPAAPSTTQARQKKRRRLSFEKEYIAALPIGERYSRSLMHRSQVLFNLFTPGTDFLITASADGSVKFWKKVQGGIEFVKEFRAHNGEVKSVSVSADGRSLATAGTDQQVMIFDVVTFDLLFNIPLAATPSSICWVHSRGTSPVLAVACEDSPEIRLYDGSGNSVDNKPIRSIPKLHRSPVKQMAYNWQFDCVISSDSKGAIEYWNPRAGNINSTQVERPSDVYKLKSETDLFVFQKAKSIPSCITICPDGRRFATQSFPDRQVRVFDFRTGKLQRTYDESLDTLEDLQRLASAGMDDLEAPNGGKAKDGPDPKAEWAEFQRRITIERAGKGEFGNRDHLSNVVFDETSNFVLYSSVMGVKVVNTVTNMVVKLYGKEESGLRPVNLALYQGQPEKKTVVTIEMAASENKLLQEAEARDAMLVTTNIGSSRFYMFTNDQSISKSSRDVLNEKPIILGGGANSDLASIDHNRNPTSGDLVVVMHTTYGDIKMRLFANVVPKTVENFVRLSRREYYNGIIFHRVIRKFMIQTGDPLGDGTGGDSCWGGEFGDEIVSNLKHDRPYTVSMANAGANTNASQFFITTEKAPWLDGKHTVFGRVTHGMDVVHKIENAATKKEKPLEDIRIINLDVPDEWFRGLK